MKPYKKRLQAGWNVGKGAKGDGEERRYAREEVAQALREMHADYLDRHRSAPTPNRRARLEHSIAWYERVIAEYDRAGRTYGYWHSALAKAKARLAELEKGLPKA